MKVELINTQTFDAKITSVDIIKSSQNTNCLIIGFENGRIEIMTWNNNKFSQIYKKQTHDLVFAVNAADIDLDNNEEAIITYISGEIKVFMKDKSNLLEISSISLGCTPTAICLANVSDDKTNELIVSTQDGALRAYGWFSGYLDKLAHKVLEKPIDTMIPIRTINQRYSRILTAYDNIIRAYVYADDRLHEIFNLELDYKIKYMRTADTNQDNIKEVIILDDKNNLHIYKQIQRGLNQINTISLNNKYEKVNVIRYKNRDYLLLSKSNRAAICLIENSKIDIIYNFKIKNHTEQSSFTIMPLQNTDNKLLIHTIDNIMEIYKIKD